MPKSSKDRIILSDSELLLAYAKGVLDFTEQKRVEELLGDELIFKEALEGLAQIKDANTLKAEVTLLQAQLRQHIVHRKNRRKAPLKAKLWLWATVAIILILLLIAWAFFSFV